MGGGGGANRVKILRSSNGESHFRSFKSVLCGNGGWIVSPTKLLPDCRNGQNKKENHAEGVFGHEMVIMGGTPAPLPPSLRKPQERQENDGPIVQHNQVRKPFEARTVQSRTHMHGEGCVYPAVPFKQNHSCCGAPSPRECRQKSCHDLKIHGVMQSNGPNSQCQMPLGQGSC